MTLTTTASSVDARIVAAATPGFPLVSRAALADVGIVRSSLRARIADGRLRPVSPTVFTIGDPDLTFDIRCMVGVLEGGPGSALFGSTALVQLACWPSERHDGMVHIAARKSTRPIPDLGIVFHRALPATPPTHAGRVPVSCAHAACLQAAVQLTPHQLAFAIGRLEFLGHLTLDSLDGFIDGARWSRGRPHARQAVRLRREQSAGTKSRSEDRALPVLADAFGEPLVNVMGAAGITDYEPDFLWRRERVIVEVDGRHHKDDPTTVRRDRERDAALRSAGWAVVRVDYRDVWRSMSRVVRELRPHFAARH